MGGNTISKLFKQHDGYTGQVATPRLDQQINDFAEEWDLEIKQVTLVSFHMSTSLQSLVIFERSED